MKFFLNDLVFIQDRAASLKLFIKIHCRSFPQELTIQISGAPLAVAITLESYVHVPLAFFDTNIDQFIKQGGYESCSFQDTHQKTFAIWSYAIAYYIATFGLA